MNIFIQFFVCVVLVKGGETCEGQKSVEVWAVNECSGLPAKAKCLLEEEINNLDSVFKKDLSAFREKLSNELKKCKNFSISKDCSGIVLTTMANLIFSGVNFEPRCGSEACSLSSNCMVTAGGAGVEKKVAVAISSSNGVPHLLKINILNSLEAIHVREFLRQYKSEFDGFIHGITNGQSSYVKTHNVYSCEKIQEINGLCFFAIKDGNDLEIIGHSSNPCNNEPCIDEGIDPKFLPNSNCESPSKVVYAFLGQPDNKYLEVKIGGYNTKFLHSEIKICFNHDCKINVEINDKGILLSFRSIGPMHIIVQSENFNKIKDDLSSREDSIQIPVQSYGDVEVHCSCNQKKIDKKFSLTKHEFCIGQHPWVISPGYLYCYHRPLMIRCMIVIIILMTFYWFSNFCAIIFSAIFVSMGSPAIVIYKKVFDKKCEKCCHEIKKGEEHICSILCPYCNSVLTKDHFEKCELRPKTSVQKYLQTYFSWVDWFAFYVVMRMLKFGVFVCFLIILCTLVSLSTAYRAKSLEYNRETGVDDPLMLIWCCAILVLSLAVMKKTLGLVISNITRLEDADRIIKEQKRLNLEISQQKKEEIKTINREQKYLGTIIFLVCVCNLIAFSEATTETEAFDLKSLTQDGFLEYKSKFTGSEYARISLSEVKREETSDSMIEYTITGIIKGIPGSQAGYVVFDGEIRQHLDVKVSNTYEELSVNFLYRTCDAIMKYESTDTCTENCDRCKDKLNSKTVNNKYVSSSDTSSWSCDGSGCFSIGAGCTCGTCWMEPKLGDCADVYKITGEKKAIELCVLFQSKAFCRNISSTELIAQKKYGFTFDGDSSDDVGKIFASYKGHLYSGPINDRSEFSNRFGTLQHVDGMTPYFDCDSDEADYKHNCFFSRNRYFTFKSCCKNNFRLIKNLHPEFNLRHVADKIYKIGNVMNDLNFIFTIKGKKPEALIEKATITNFKLTACHGCFKCENGLSLESSFTSDKSGFTEIQCDGIAISQSHIQLSSSVNKINIQGTSRVKDTNITCKMLGKSASLSCSLKPALIRYHENDATHISGTIDNYDLCKGEFFCSVGEFFKGVFNASFSNIIFKLAFIIGAILSLIFLGFLIYSTIKNYKEGKFQMSKKDEKKP